MRLRLALLLLAGSVAACRCDDSLDPVETGFRIKEKELDFGRVLEGTRAELPVTVDSTGRGSLSLTLSATAPFEVQDELELPGGGSVPVKVTFAAGDKEE